ncbi:MAG: hypothetical protein OXT67_04000 [Zetaproteobacteria bacterium]|nr:hypothetical protein [Zetaproteobacteria bacterium]
MNMLGLREFVSRYPGYFLALLSLLYVCASKPYPNGPHIRSDGVGYHMWTKGFMTGDFSFCKYGDMHVYGGEGVFSYQGSERCLIKYPPGVALLRLPLMIWFTDPQETQHISLGEHTVSMLCGALALILIVLLLHLLLQAYGVSSIDAQFTNLGAVLGTGLFHYGTYDNGFSHVYSSLLCSGILFLFFYPGIRLQRIRTMIFVLFLSLFLVRSTNIFMAIALCAFYLVQQRFRFQAFQVCAVAAGGTTCAILLQVMINAYATGEMTLSSYGGESFLWHRPMTWSVLMSYDRGLFLYYPIFTLFVSVGMISRVSRPLCVLLVGLVSVYSVLYGFWHSWALGAGFGHRGFVEVVPVGALALGLALPYLSEVSRKFVRLCVMIFTLMTLVLMQGYWFSTLPAAGTSGVTYWEHLKLLHFSPYFALAFMTVASIMYLILWLRRKSISSLSASV